MKRIFSVALFGAAVAILGGCPIYPDGAGDSRPCEGNGCYDDCSSSGCPWGYYCGQDGRCASENPPAEDAGAAPDATFPVGCTQPIQCPAEYTCGANNQCDLGNCSVTGCPTGYVCELENGAIQCVATGTPIDAGRSPDSGTPDSGVACQSNADCASTPGALCLDGVCTAPPNQCYDGTQCPSGDKCVQGACTPSCTTSTDGGAGLACPTGYACTNVDDSSASGVCSGNPTPCSTNPGVCANGTICSQDHCVLACGDGGTCPKQEVCIAGGCVPNEQPIFTCTTDGVQDACAPGSICLHHSCYIGCNPEAGAAACQSADQFNECKAVTTSTGTYDVCGSSTNLGNQCNPTDGQTCSSSAAVCIDGFCH